MNSELEAIMRRRRRKADGLPGSPSPHRKSKETTAPPPPTRSTSTRASRPALPPPPSSVPTTRRQKLTMRRSSPPAVAEVKSPGGSTRRRALDQIRRGSRHNAGGGHSFEDRSASPTLSPEKQQQVNDSMVAVASTPASHKKQQQQVMNDSIMTQEAVVHGISDVSAVARDDSMSMVQQATHGATEEESIMDVLVAVPTDESNVLSPQSVSSSVATFSHKSSPTYSSSPTKSIIKSPTSQNSNSSSVESSLFSSEKGSSVATSSPRRSSPTYSSPTYSSPTKSIKSLPSSSYSSPTKSIKSPLSFSNHNDECIMEVDSSAEESPVNKPAAAQSITKQQEAEYDSSSQEEEEERVVPTSSPPLFETAEPSAVSTSFGHFEADFGASFPTTNAFSNPEYDEPPVFDTRTEYEPPPVFAAFEPLPEPVDYTPLENVPTPTKPTVLLKESTVISAGKQYHCPPTMNPLNGNVITCRTSTKNNTEVIGIHEIQVETGAQVEYTLVLTDQVQSKFKTIYGITAVAVSQVKSIAAGVHRSQGQARVRVAALVEFQTLNSVGKEMLKTVLMVWQWGYGGSKPVALQSLLSPPNKASFTYDAESLQMADGVVFLSGNAKNKGPCVFTVQPYVKDVWSANLIPGNEAISVLAVAGHAKYKYVAIAQTDGSLSVWTYENAVNRKGAAAESPKSLFPLARLFGATAIPTTGPTVGDEDGYIGEEKGYCSSLAWTNDSSGLLLLAAAFTHGMAVYHVSLPLLKEGDTTKPIPEPTASTQLSQTVLLPFFVAARWASPIERASVSWVELGPSSCLSFLLKKDSTVKAIMGVVNLPLYGGEVKENALYTFTVLASNVLTISVDESSTMDRVGYVSSGAALLHKKGSITSLKSSLSSDAYFFRSLRSPTISAAPGLDSAGYVSLSDAVADDDSILQIFTVKQCKRETTELPSPVPSTERLDWSPPKQRFLLCRSFMGDRKDAQDPSPAAQKEAEYGEIETVTSGNYMKLICDINMPDLVPRRIVRCKGTDLCAVIMYHGVEHTEGPSTDAVSVALIDTGKGKLVDVHEGRDIVFLPNAKSGEEQALVLSVDGSSIHMLRRIPPADGNEASTWEQGDSARSLLGVEANDDYVEGSKLVLLSSEGKMALFVVGTRVRDGRTCLVLGDFASLKADDADTWKGLIPSVKKSSVTWLQPMETVQAILNLPSYQGGRHVLAVATNLRVLLLSTELKVVAEVTAELSSPSLAPLGSHTVAYCSRDFKLRYLCCLGGKFSKGLLATLPSPRLGHDVYQLMAVRPDRFVYTNTNSGVRLVEQGGNEHTFSLPPAITRPALLLEPLVANALCESAAAGEPTAVLRSVIERFGRKVAPFPHGDDEGIGPAGSGLTPAVFEMLAAHGLKHPASWLMTGTCRLDRAATSKILPPWMPVNSKVAAALNPDAYLHVLSNGDQYFSDYVKSPDQNMASTLPRPSDPSAAICHELARKAMEDGDVAGVLKMLDMAGSTSSDSELLQLALSSQLDQSADPSKVLATLSGQGDGYTRGSATNSSTSSSLAALALDLQSRQVNGRVPQQSGECEKSSEEFRRTYMTQLAPSLQRSRKVQRVRHRLIGESAMAAATRGIEKIVEPDSLWENPCNESKHVWNEGPQKEKENLLLLDRMEEWLGRKRPAVLGKEGAEVALERGEKTLADILNQGYDDDSFGGESAGEGALLKDGWVEGVGEGRSDEDNLSFYLRMSEGADEDSTWRTDGMVDLTMYANKATLLGRRDCFALQPTSSSVDEGEPGKVKLLYDLVFEAPTDGEGPGGLLVEAPRGSSLDVGMLHGDAHDARRKCSLEFWFHLPVAESVKDDIVLARRSVASQGVDIARLCDAHDNEGFLWDLVLLKSGELEFRSNGGTSMISTSESSEFEPSQSMGDFGDDTQGSNEDGGLVSWARTEGGGGWNHVCLVFSSRNQQSQGDCAVKMFLKGARVASTVAQIVPPGLNGEELKDTNMVDDVMKNTMYLFGLNAVPDYRMTEVRMWSCERSEDDIKMMMYEYLRAAETKKKFKVKIRNKRGGGSAEPKPSSGGLLSPPPSGFLSPPRDNSGAKSLRPPPRARSEVGTSSTTQLEEKNFAFDASFRTFEKVDEDEPLTEKEEQLKAEGAFASEQNFLPEKTMPPPPPPPPPGSPPRRHRSRNSQQPSAVESTWSKMQNEDALVPASSYPTSPPDKDVQGDNEEALVTQPSVLRLSREVRSSAAAALVRGPPATRHFGGNRGGLSRANPTDRNLSKRYGVGAIAICGQEKTVVFDHDQEPRGKTYPIGASGAIISDEMDNGEYLCCFLAKDKRMVVFELLTRTVVVELQMTTKLNFWRYLPPQAHGHTLAFMLITPVGGFHWVPLDESPRPIQVWKRGPALQGKKIVTYEEGGSNGFRGAEALSAVALLLVSTASTGTPLEAWILQVGGESQALCVSSNVLGAALFRPYHIEDEAFLPHLVTVAGVESEIVLKVEPLSQNPATGELAVEDVSIGAILDQSQVRRSLFSPPALAMGGWPEVICCTCQGFVVACVRRKGLVVAYDCQEELVLVRQEHVNNYIVDGALRPASGEGVELMLLLSDSDNPRDGFVMSIEISR